MEVGWYSAILECLGWWNLNCCTFFTGYLGVTSLASQVIIGQVKNFTTMIPTGVAFTASGLVGNLLGMNQVERAKQYERVTICFSMLVTALMLTIFWIFRNALAGIFTDNQQIIDTVKTSFWSLFLYIFFSTIKGVQNGVVRALEKQAKNTLITLTCAYLIGIPLAYSFCFKVGMGLPGLWFGIAIANFLLVLCINCLIRSQDWQAIADEAIRKEEERKAK